MPPPRAVVDKALAEGRRWLDPLEVAALLDAYGIPATPVALAADPAQAEAAAQPFLAQGTPVALKILSPDIQHKSDVDGVRLNLASGHAVREDGNRAARTSRRRPPVHRRDRPADWRAAGP